MTYKDHFVVEVKCAGKILRVQNGAVYLPFGSEYSILLKNLNTKRAAIKVSVDGQDALDHHQLVLDPNDSTELMGFMQGNVARNAFRFIQKTKQIQDHRGDKVDDGLVRVEFAFEKPKPEVITKTIIHEVHKYPFSYPYVWYDHSSPSWHYTYGSTSRGSVRGMSGGASGQMIGSVQNSSMPVGEVNTCYNVSVENLSYQPNKDEGITVKGSEVYQAFNYTSIGELEQAEVIIIQLKGSGDTGVVVEKPITVQTKLVCKTCGTTSPSNNKYCSNCGTYLLS
jgi:hypothetical protein